MVSKLSWKAKVLKHSIWTHVRSEGQQKVRLTSISCNNGHMGYLWNYGFFWTGLLVELAGLSNSMCYCIFVFIYKLILMNSGQVFLRVWCWIKKVFDISPEHMMCVILNGSDTVIIHIRNLCINVVDGSLFQILQCWTLKTHP